MLINMAFGLLPALLAGVFIYGSFYWILMKVLTKLGKNTDERKKEVRFYTSFAFVVFMLHQVWSSWQTYGYLVEAHPFGHQQMQYEPQKTEIPTGSKLIEVEDKSGTFKQKAQEKPQ